MAIVGNIKCFSMYLYIVVVSVVVIVSKASVTEVYLMPNDHWSCYNHKNSSMD